MRYKIETKNQKIHITVTLNSAGTHARPQPRHRLNKKNIIKILILEKIKHGECIIDPGYLSNFEEAPVLTKTWVFKCIPELELKPTTPKPKKKTSTRRSTRRTNKNKKNT